MRIYTRHITDFDGNVLEAEWYEHEGEIAHAGGAEQSGEQTMTVEPPSYLVPYLRGAANEVSGAYAPFSQGGGAGGSLAQAPSREEVMDDIGVSGNGMMSGMIRDAVGQLYDKGAFDPQGGATPPSPGQSGQGGQGAPMTTVPGISDDRLAAFDMKRDIAGGSPQYLDEAGSYLSGVLEQGPTDLTSQLDSAYRNARRSVDSSFASAGRFGSGLNEAARAEAFAGQAAPLMENARQFDESRRMQAAGMLPQIDAAQFASSAQRAGLLEDVGAQQEEHERNEALGRFEPIQNYVGLLSALSGGAGQTQSTPMYRNRSSGLLGGALGGAGLASTLGLSNPWTAGLAIGGGLLGAL